MSIKILSLNGLTKRFGAVTAADAINLTLAKGEVLALLGENGAGKTTLMNMLFGQYTPDAGSVVVHSENGAQTLPPGQPQAAIDARIGMVHQHFTLAENLSVLDNILLGSEKLFALRRDLTAARAKITDLMQVSGLVAPLDERVSALSVGEKQRVEILKALFRDVRVLVLDEPTAVLTPQEADTLFASIRKMASHGLAVIFISHKLREVLAFSDRIAVLRHGKKVGEMRTSDADQQKIAAMMVGAETPPLSREAVEPGPVVLSLKKASISSDNARQRLNSVDLELREGQIAGIAGVSGNGQTALANLISGLVQMQSGEMYVAGNALDFPSVHTISKISVGRIPEDRHQDGVVGAMSVAENLVLERLDDPEIQRNGFLRREAITANANRLTEAFDVRGPGIDARAALLSGGNIQKLILARVLDREPTLIIANQPTRGLDFGAAAEVGRRLLDARKRGAGVVLISEDLDEILDLSDRIFVMHDGELTETNSRDRAKIGLLMTGHAA